ncbi:protein spinster homolog 1-like isoform X2 [Gigantopelta aegis]|uniref:protein spinster homolog 1-like isoform X2 n=1 Tax=Gigantopelta aegis TaxID=1735272 RepID=UPI001B88BEBB|nr:protein spinster homolog 1-like isoform X2 [Gigantopelta aegis]
MQMSKLSPPFDDTVQLEEMPVDFPDSDTAPIVPSSDLQDNEVIDATVPKHQVEDGSHVNSIISNKAAAVTVFTLLFINLLNYMDRFTIAGVLPEVEKYYGIHNTRAGLIQTSFIIVYMLCSPVFGYLGDRYSRKYIMAAGIFFWSGFTLSASFVPKDAFWAFIVLRALVGIGEASYSTIAPTIIADLFAKEMRTKMLMVFYFAIPVGSGLGYIVGSKFAQLMGSWEWALRITPTLGIICVILIIIVLKEPQRGLSDGATHLKNTSVTKDLVSLLHNKSFILSSVGFTCVAYVTGALAFWAPTFMLNSIKVQGHNESLSTVSLIFGVLTVLAGLIGVALGAETARRYKRKNPRADPLICAFGMLSCVPFLFLALFTSQYNTPATWVLIFLGEVMLCLNWPIVADMLLYVVIPTRRSLAEAFQILVSHLFGDAGSPYLIGQVSDVLAVYFSSSPKSAFVKFVTLQYALYSTPFVCVIGGGAFLATALFIEADRKKAEDLAKGPDLSDSNEALDAQI